MSKRRNYIEKNFISYEELMLMDKEKLVKVSISFLYYLIAKSVLLEIKDENIQEILKKYLDAINMQEFIGEKIYSYCLMTTEDVVYLFSLLNIKSYSKGKILIFNYTYNFEEYYQKLKERYITKLLEMNIEQTCNPVRKRI